MCVCVCVCVSVHICIFCKFALCQNVNLSQQVIFHVLTSLFFSFLSNKFLVFFILRNCQKIIGNTCDD